jgi:hypothetical protein
MIQLMKQRFERSKVASPEAAQLIEAASKVDLRAVSIQRNGETVNLIAPRALFALATAEALLRSMIDNHGHDTALFIQTLQREDVVRDIIVRERQARWAAHSKPKKLPRYETLLALVTFVQGIDMTQLDRQ